jgi:hypothetical protein
VFFAENTTVKIFTILMLGILRFITAVIHLEKVALLIVLSVIDPKIYVVHHLVEFEKVEPTRTHTVSIIAIVLLFCLELVIFFLSHYVFDVLKKYITLMYRRAVLRTIRSRLLRSSNV